MLGRNIVSYLPIQLSRESKCEHHDGSDADCNSLTFATSLSMKLFAGAGWLVAPDWPWDLGLADGIWDIVLELTARNTHGRVQRHTSAPTYFYTESSIRSQL